MKAYLNDPQLKEKFLAEIIKHEKADAIAQGTYGMGTGEDWKGCAVGCSLRSLEIATGQQTHNPGDEERYSDHGKYETMLGIPMVLARIEDRIFEGLSSKEAKTWPRRFAEAINVGADLSKIWPKFAVWMLTDAKDGVIKFANGREDVIAAIKRVADLYQESAEGHIIPREKWLEARELAWKARQAAAYAAAYAADAYAADAYDAYAAYAAYAAAAYAAAYAADAYAARSKHFSRMSEKLIELLNECR